MPGLERIGRDVVSVVLIVLSTVLLVLGSVALYARQEVIDPQAFADRAGNALKRDEVKRVVSREIVVQLVERGNADLISARPVLESVVGFVVESPPFRRLFREAALQGNRVLFVRGQGNVAFNIADAGTIVVSTLRSVAPNLAKKVPPGFDASVGSLRGRSFATGTLRFADDVRALGIVLPLLALVGFALAIVVCTDRRTAVTRVGIAVGAGAGVLIAVLLIVQAYIVAHVSGTDELTDSDVRDAVSGVLNSFVHDLVVWAFVVGAFALVVAAASSSLLQPFESGRAIDRFQQFLRPPERASRRALRGTLVIVLGAFVVLQPALAVKVLAVGFGALLLYMGTSELLSAIRPRSERAEKEARGRLWPALGIGAGVIAACAVALVVIISGGGKASQAQANVRTCNGYVQLCNRRLDQVLFAGAHNAMSSADQGGWLLVNQRRTIRRQLRDGIRLFLIDPHYGRQDANGKVRTDFEAEKRGVNRVGAKLTPEARAALERLGGSIGLGNFAKGKRDVWLCHSVCELGATKMVNALTVMRRFLQSNPGEVIILFDEDYVSEKDLDRVYHQSGMYPYLATLRRDQPLPTLRQLIDSGKRAIVFTERIPSGQYPWDHNGFSFIQDTPLKATKPSQLSCDRYRGQPSSPLFMINNWIDRFPPPASANRAVLRRSFIEARVRRCAKQRGLKPSLIASDFYDEGKLVDAVRRLNGLRGKPAPTF